MKLSKKQLELINYTKVELSKLTDASGDTEIQHIEADELLCGLLNGLGFNDIVEIYEDVSKWYA